MTAANEQLLTAAREGNLKSVQEALQEGADINARDEYKQTALQHALQTEHYEVAQYLLDYKDSDETKPMLDINAIDAWDVPTLFYACSWGTVELVKQLIDAGADTDYKTPRVGDTALHLAAQNKTHGASIVQYLVEHVGFDAAVTNEEEGGTALHTACTDGNIPAAQALLGFCPDLLHAKDTLSGDTPLHAASTAEMVDFLMNSYRGGDKDSASSRLVNVRNSFGLTPLHTSMSYGHFAAVPALLKWGANLYDDVKDEGGTPFDIIDDKAEADETTEIVEILLRTHKGRLVTQHATRAVLALFQSVEYWTEQDTAGVDDDEEDTDDDDMDDDDKENDDINVEEDSEEESEEDYDDDMEDEEEEMDGIEREQPEEPKVIHLPLGWLTATQFITLLQMFPAEQLQTKDENGQLPLDIATKDNAPKPILDFLQAQQGNTTEEATGGV